MSARPVVAVSSCLIGERVRYDGTHRRDPWLVERLGRHVDFRPLCPETAVGLGVPRSPIRLLGEPGDVRAVGVEDPERDVTARLVDFARRIAETLGATSGYVFKSGSPSCGLAGVKLYGPDGTVRRKGTGIYARELLRRSRNLPVAEAERLHEPLPRECFLNRLFTYHRWRTLRGSAVTRDALRGFHARQRLLVVAHSAAAYRRLGQLLEAASGGDLEAVADRYEAELMRALGRPVSRQRHAWALKQLLGELGPYLAAAERRQLAELLDAYRHGAVARLVPLEVLRHHVRHSRDPELCEQTYLRPYPDALA